MHKRLPSPPQDPLLSTDHVRKGVPVKALNDLADLLNVERLILAEICGTSLRTLQRKGRDRGRLGPAASDRLARIRRIVDLASEILGETNKAARWLTTESRALDGQMPLYMLDTDIGTQRVQQELRQIQFGMPL